VDEVFALNAAELLDRLRSASSVEEL